MKSINKKLLYILAAITLLVSGCANTSNPNYVSTEKLKTMKFLNESQVKALHSNNTIVGDHFKSKTKFSISYMANGTYKGDIRNGAKMISGSWSVKGDTLCHSRASGKKSCRKYYMKDGKYYSYNPDNNFITASFKVK